MAYSPGKSREPPQKLVDCHCHDLSLEDEAMHYVRGKQNQVERRRKPGCDGVLILKYFRHHFPLAFARRVFTFASHYCRHRLSRPLSPWSVLITCGCNLYYQSNHPALPACLVEPGNGWLICCWCWLRCWCWDWCGAGGSRVAHLRPRQGRPEALEMEGFTFAVLSRGFRPTFADFHLDFGNWHEVLCNPNRLNNLSAYNTEAQIGLIMEYCTSIL